MEYSAHWARVKEIFTQALDQSPETPEDFARWACGSDGAVLQDVLRLTGKPRPLQPGSFAALVAGRLGATF